MKDLGVFQKEFKKLDFDLQVHALMLIDISSEIARRSNKRINKNKLIACAVLHDSKNHEKNHEKVCAEYAKKFLEKAKFSKAFVNEVYNAIYNHDKKSKVKDFTIACFYDADVLCRFYALGILRAWNNIKVGSKNWKKLFIKLSKKSSLKKYLTKMEKNLQLKESKKLLQSKKDEYLFSHELLRKMLLRS